MPLLDKEQTLDTIATRPGSGAALLLFVASASILAYEILLMRIFSLTLWYHCAYLVISMALLGFGLAGSLLFRVYPRIRNPEPWLMTLALLAALAFPLAFFISQKVNLDPLQLVWQGRQHLRLVAVYLVMALPFVFAGGIIALVLTWAGEQAHRFYAVDLLGAGFGSVLILPALYWALPWKLLCACGGLLLLAAFLFCLQTTSSPFYKRMGLWMIPGVAVLLSAGHFFFSAAPEIHEAKALPMVLDFPDSRIEAVRTGPLAVVQVADSALIRHAPGLSLYFGLDPETSQGAIPRQKLLFFDADNPSPVVRFKEDPASLAYLDYTTPALPYFVRPAQTSLIIGAGGGAEILLALHHHLTRITALEENPQVHELMRGFLADFSGRIYSRPEVTVPIREARQFLAAYSGQGFDLIQFSQPGAAAGAAGGLQSPSENYLLTIEAFELYLSRLTGNGILSITCPLQYPPRASLRLVSTAATVLRNKLKHSAPGEHLLLIRSWKTCTLLVSRRPFSAAEIRQAASFCEKRAFDLCFYHGMQTEETNRFDIQPVPYDFLGSKALAGPHAQAFMDNYSFAVSPSTDDRPYFSHTLRWNKIFRLLEQLRRESLPMLESGYIFIAAALLQAVPVSALLIFLPLLGLRRNPKSSSVSCPVYSCILLYFGSIGLAFMFLEMTLLAKFTLLLAQPVYAATVVLATILVSAGCGSLWIKKIQDRRPALLNLAWPAITACGLGLVFGGDKLLRVALAWSPSARILLTMLYLLLLAFFLGWPFPAGLRILSKQSPNLVPWAWSVNACASVLGAVLAKTLTMDLGFRFVLLTACGLYLSAGVLFHFIFHNEVNTL